MTLTDSRKFFKRHDDAAKTKAKIARSPLKREEFSTQGWARKKPFAML